MIEKTKEKKMSFGAVCNGNPEMRAFQYPCPHCGSLTYLGIFIPTVTVIIADYYPTTFQCKNPNCAPIYKKHVYNWDKDGKECEPYTFNELIDCGAYWCAEDDCYFTPHSPRL